MTGSGPVVSPFWARKVGRALIGVGVALLLLGAVWTAVQTTVTVQLVRDTQLENAQRAKDTQANTEAIEAVAREIRSCTSPRGECAQRSAQRSADVVTTINQTTMFAAVCAAQGNDTVREVRRCVNGLLSRFPPPFHPPGL